LAEKIPTIVYSNITGWVTLNLNIKNDVLIVHSTMACNELLTAIVDGSGSMPVGSYLKFIATFGFSVTTITFTVLITAANVASLPR
jgi:hypothetical protein